MRKMIIGLLLIALITNIASAAGNESLLSPGMGMKWYDTQPQEFKDLIIWCIGGLFFILGVIFIATSGAAAGKGMLDKSGFGNPEEKSKSNSALLGIALTLVGVMILIAVGLGVFKWF